MTALPIGTPVTIPSAHGEPRQGMTACAPFTWSGLTLVAVSGLSSACACPMCRRASPFFETRVLGPVAG
jgi:hypothetical protein